MKSNQGITTFYSLPWLLGWASFSVIGPLVLAKVIYRTCQLAVAYFSNRHKEFRGKTVMITGASSGLGKAMAHSLYKRGCKLILASRNINALDELKETLLMKYKPPELHIPTVVYLDLEDLNSIPVIIEQLVRGHGHIDVLINNAGISYRGEIASTDLSVDIKTMVINYFGQVSLTKAVLKGMMARKKGHIVGVGSVQGRVAIPYRSCYGASKHAFQSFFDCLRAEVASHNINVTIVSPGYMKTDLSVHAITGQGNSYGVMDESEATGMPPEYVAERIARCLVTKESDLLLCPYLHKILIFLRTTFPSLTFYIMKLRAQNTQHKPKKGKYD